MAREQDRLNPTGPATTGAGTTTTTAGPAKYPEGTSADAIREDIARTRAEMDETVDALGDRLRPRHLLDDLLEYVTGKRPDGNGSASTHVRERVGDAVKATGSVLLDKVKEHPLPAALITAGVAWMFIGGEGGSRRHAWRGGHARGQWRDLPEYGGSYVDARTGEPYDTEHYGDAERAGRHESPGIGERARHAAGSAASGVASGARHAASGTAHAIGGVVSSAAHAVGSAVSGAAHLAGSAVSGAAHLAGEAVSGAAHVAKEGAEAAGDAIGDAAHATSHGVSSAASATGHGVSHAASGAGHYAHRGYDSARDGLVTAMEEYPLATGVAALAVGAIAGLLIPATRREHELMGEYAEEVKHRAEHAGKDLLERGKAIADAAASAATDAVREHDADPDHLVDKARHVADDTASAAAQSVGKVIDDVKQAAPDIKHAAEDSARREGVHPEQLKEAAKDVAKKTKDAAKHEAQAQHEQHQR